MFSFVGKKDGWVNKFFHLSSFEYKINRKKTGFKEKNNKNILKICITVLLVLVSALLMTYWRLIGAYL